jgi:DNA-binding YbaB/EbfC family protein
MAKRKAPRMPRSSRGGGGFGGNAMLSQLQKLEEEMARTQEELAKETIEVSVGGGAVTVVVNGQQEIQSITISPDVVDPDDVEMLQDLIVAAVREAMTKSSELAAERMSALTGGLNIPGLL